MSIQRVVCPIDFSDFSKRAFEHALAIATWYGARVKVLYVHHVPSSAASLIPGVPLEPVQALVLTPEDYQQLLREVEAFVRGPGTTGVPVEYRVSQGDAATEILAEARAADLLVMGTHGRTGFEHLVLGSVTEKVLRKTACPLLTIPRASAGAAAAAPSRVHHILVGVDFSAPSLRALSFALSLAKEAGARVTLLHAIDLPEHPALFLNRPDGTNPVRAVEEATESRLRSAASDAVRRQIHVDERVVTGRPYRELLRLAADRHAGLIVVGAHGNDAIQGMFVGSTAQHLVRQAECPVLTIR
jgi:nucleotide-binding universal stress UspA family protein